VAKLKMAAEDPAFKEKYPKIASMLDKLQDMGAAAGSAMRRENEEMAEELEETKKALETVSKELNEVNLLNSKLLYVNRIFKANTLDESQKLRVVESLDKASSTKEAKLIYETIKDTFNISKNTKSSSKRKSIKENLGMASKATGTSTAPKKEVISESNDMVARFKKLANIKINE
jgi:2,3-bisphosphoglycerate-independent phosphoglycerate mutase